MSDSNQMTPQQRQTSYDLLLRRISREEFLVRFGECHNGSDIALAALGAALRTREAELLEIALGLGFVFGLPVAARSTLCELVDLDWHHSHEDVVFTLSQMPDEAVTDCLYRATQIVPEYLRFDDSRALAVKAIVGLGRIGTAKSKERLEVIARSNNPILRDIARRVLDRAVPGADLPPPTRER